MASQDQTVRAMALEIERYLSAHHDAADSPQGIQGFWLPPHLRSEPLDWVLSALEDLQQRGVVAKTEIDGVGPVYGRAVRGRVH